MSKKEQFEAIRDEWLNDKEIPFWDLTDKLEKAGFITLVSKVEDVYDKGWKLDGRGFYAVELFFREYVFSEQEAV